MAAKRGAPRAASYFYISDNLYIKFDNNDKKRELREPVAKFDIIPKFFSVEKFYTDAVGSVGD